LTKAGESVEGIEIVGNPMPHVETCGMLGQDMVEMLKANRHLPLEEKKRCMDELAERSLRAIEEAGLDCETSPLLAKLPLG
jgi:hypothetical protein